MYFALSLIPFVVILAMALAPGAILGGCCALLLRRFKVSPWVSVSAVTVLVSGAGLLLEAQGMHDLIQSCQAPNTVQVLDKAEVPGYPSADHIEGLGLVHGLHVGSHLFSDSLRKAKNKRYHLRIIESDATTHYKTAIIPRRYSVKYELVDRETNKVLATATEQLFQRSTLGVALVYWNRNEARRWACGYASNTPHIFRNNWSGTPTYNAYLKQDRALLSPVLGD